MADLAHLGITEAFPIQELTLPVALDGHDVIGQAKTGTGKTLGFALPLLERLAAPNDPVHPDHEPSATPQALVVVPTRELAMQVANEIRHASKTRGARVLTVYGGRSYEPQVEALEAGVDVVVGTPGRLLDLVEKRHLHLGAIKTLVLDEADEMLDMGFLPDVERIVALTPADRQTMLFSATMPGDVIALARRYMNQPTHIRAIDPDEDNSQLVKRVQQHAYRTHPVDKAEIVARILQSEGRGHTIIFCPTKRQAQKLADDLSSRGFAVGSVHGDLGQGAREQAMRAFRNGKVDVLVATDVAARGIDIDGITHVVNYSCPDDEKTYIHRIGRTARAGNTGVAVTLVDWQDLPRWILINKTLGLSFPDPVETYSTSPHLFADLDIPVGTKGELPKAQRTREGLAAEELEDLGETGKARRQPRSPDSGPSRGGSKPREGGGSKPREGGGQKGSQPRNRQRTRGGSSTGSTNGASTANGAAPATASASATTGDGASDAPRRRRRRRRGGSAGTSTEPTTA
ncbi:MAG: DEAD/DEAH box helicase [Actinomycetia bacterium]|nr:DEAD/DEAH box helicase [Actinomycetes bacterium]